MNPLLTVLIDTYNHERYIEQAVISAIEQDFPSSAYEILVVDDGSTDRTPEIVRKFAPRVRLLQKKNGGQASAFNAAFPEIRGDIVAFLDGDDWFAPGKVTAVMHALEEFPESAAVGHGYYEFHETSGETKICCPSQPAFLHLGTREAAREASPGWSFGLMGALTVRRAVFERVVPIPEILVFCGDAPILISSMVAGIRVLAQPLFYYRHHSSNLQATGPANVVRLRRKTEMNEITFQILEPLLVRFGVPRESVAAFLYPHWVGHSRFRLRAIGGSRIETFKTEMRAFRLDHTEATIRYCLFKYLIVGGATLLVPPASFYRIRDWYAQRNLGRFREQFARSR
jgi:glycosyltransferase involved in cell wall biosynthesis